MTLLIHAPNVHDGGGKTLLIPLLRAARQRAPVAAVVDARLRLPKDLATSINLTRVAPGLGARLAAEWRLRRLAAPGDTVLCFGNLPPLFGARGRVVLFLQNRYLAGRHSTRGLPHGARVRIAVERAWLRTRVRGVDRVLVQTASMAREVRDALDVSPDVVPFAPAPAVMATRGTRPPVDFLYVSSAEPHKNHRTLLAAWRQLAEGGFRPSLCLTVAPDQHPALCAEIEAARSTHGVNIENAGAVDAAALEGLYGSARAFIYPSRFESLGLPLLEAHAHGLPILAPELDYVRDVVEPAETFDAESAVSIARAVKRFSHRRELPAVVLTPEQFIERIF